jgi:hypothetical protein
MSRNFLQPAIVITLVILISISCNIPGVITQPQQMGTIKIVNYHVRGSDPFPGGMNLPDAREYGVCFIAYQPTNPGGLTRPSNDMILAKDEETTTYALPAGTYTLQEWQFDSEINQDPLYSPAMKTLVRPPETIVLGANKTLVFGSERTLDPPGDFVEGNPINPSCGGGSAQTAIFPTDTPEAAGGAWVLKLVQPDVGKSEAQFSFPGLACSGGAVATSAETTATIVTTGTCQVNGALVADETTQHSWSRPPDQLTPGEEMTGTLTASSSGLCSWKGLETEENCRGYVATSHSVWQGDGWPGGETEFPYQYLIFGNDSAGTARASNHPTGSFKWTVPDGSYGGKTLVLQFHSTASQGGVYTNFWYEWEGQP